MPEPSITAASRRSKLGRCEEAIADLNEAIRLNPTIASAFNSRGVAKAELERHEAAITDFEEAIRLNPEEAGAF